MDWYREASSGRRTCQSRQANIGSVNAWPKLTPVRAPETVLPPGRARAPALRAVRSRSRARCRVRRCPLLPPGARLRRQTVLFHRKFEAKATERAGTLTRRDLGLARTL